MKLNIFNKVYKKLLLSSMNGWQVAEYYKKKEILHHQGEGCYFSSINFGTEGYLISIGNNVYVAAGVSFITHDAGAIMLNKIYGYEHPHDMVGPISIGNNVFIGAGSIILMNVNIGSNCIVGAGSVVTRDVPDNTVVAGVPARKINNFNTYVKKMEDFTENVPWANLLEENTNQEAVCKKRIEYFFGKNN